MTVWLQNRVAVSKKINLGIDHFMQGADQDSTLAPLRAMS